MNLFLIFAAMKFFGAIRILFLSLGLLFLIGTSFQVCFSLFRETEVIQKHPNDHFDPSLLPLNSLDKLEALVDSLAGFSQVTGKEHIEKYAELADSVVRMRFYYGLQNYMVADNFIANLAGKYLWSHLGAKVDPEHILDGRKAYCSQSSIVFQELLKRKGFDVRTVRLANHFCTEVMINGNWGFFDVSYKPDFRDTPRLSTEQLIAQPEYLENAYLYSFREDFSKNLLYHFEPEKITYGKVNEFPARRMLLFHRITWFLSWFGWAIFILSLIFLFLRNQKKNNNGKA